MVAAALAVGLTSAVVPRYVVACHGTARNIPQNLSDWMYLLVGATPGEQLSARERVHEGDDAGATEAGDRNAGYDAGASGGVPAAGGDVPVFPTGGREPSNRGRQGPPGQNFPRHGAVCHGSAHGMPRKKSNKTPEIRSPSKSFCLLPWPRLVLRN